MEMTELITVDISPATMSWMFAFNANCIKDDMDIMRKFLGTNAKEYFEEYVQGLNSVKLKLKDSTDEYVRTNYNEGIEYMKDAESILQENGYSVREPLESPSNGYVISKVMLTRTPFSTFNYDLKSIKYAIDDVIKTSKSQLSNIFKFWDGIIDDYDTIDKILNDGEHSDVYKGHMERYNSLKTEFKNRASNKKASKRAKQSE